MIISVRTGRKFLSVNIGERAYKLVLEKSNGNKNKLRDNKFYIIKKAGETAKKRVSFQFARRCLWRRLHNKSW